MDPGERGEGLVLECGVGVEVGGDDAQEIVGVAEESLGLDDVRDAGDGFFERQQGVAVFLAHGDEHEGLERESDGLGVEDGPVAGDHPATFELTQAAMAGRETEPDLGGQFGNGQPAVAL